MGDPAGTIPTANIEELACHVVDPERSRRELVEGVERFSRNIDSYRQAKLEGQTQIKALEAARNEKRRELFDAQDAIDVQRDELIDKIEKQMQQRTTVQTLFIIRWTLQ